MENDRICIIQSQKIQLRDFGATEEADGLKYFGDKISKSVKISSSRSRSDEMIVSFANSRSRFPHFYLPFLCPQINK